MPDKDMLDFLAGVKAYEADIEVRDDVVVAVATVGGPFAEYRSEEEHASWIVEACRRASRTCETCGRSYYALGRLCCDAVNPDGEWVEPDHFCGYYEPKDAADDKWHPPSCFPGEAHDWERLAQREWPAIACCRICGLTLVEGEEDGMQEDEEAADA